MRRFRTVEYSWEWCRIICLNMVACREQEWGGGYPQGIQIIAVLKCCSKIQEAILCPFLNPQHQLNELLYSHSGINERNKARRGAAGRTGISHPDGIRPCYPQSSPAPQTMVKKQKKKKMGAYMATKRYYIDLRRVAKSGWWWKQLRSWRDEVQVRHKESETSLSSDGKQTHRSFVQQLIVTKKLRLFFKVTPSGWSRNDRSRGRSVKDVKVHVRRRLVCLDQSDRSLMQEETGSRRNDSYCGNHGDHQYSTTAEVQDTWRSRCHSSEMSKFRKRPSRVRSLTSSLLPFIFFSVNPIMVWTHLTLIGFNMFSLPFKSTT